MGLTSLQLSAVVLSLRHALSCPVNESGLAACVPIVECIKANQREHE